MLAIPLNIITGYRFDTQGVFIDIAAAIYARLNVIFCGAAKLDDN